MHADAKMRKGEERKACHTNAKNCACTRAQIHMEGGPEERMDKVLSRRACAGAAQRARGGSVSVVAWLHMLEYLEAFEEVIQVLGLQVWITQFLQTCFQCIPTAVLACKQHTFTPQHSATDVLSDFPNQNALPLYMLHPTAVHPLNFTS